VNEKKKPVPSIPGFDHVGLQKQLRELEKSLEKIKDKK